MNRRNVLGNKIESAKTMWIVLISLLVMGLQFVIYHVAEGRWPGFLLAGGCVLLGGIVVHFITGELEEVFSYLLIPCILTGCTGLLLPYLQGTLLPQSSTVFIGCVLSWLLPVVYACIFTWIEGSPAMSHFTGFYKKATVFFYLIYFGLLIYWFVEYNRLPEDQIKVQMIPFAGFAAYIDGVISNTVPMERLLQFLAGRVLLFLPYGFFIAMIGRKLHSMLRLGLVVLLPALVELLQFLLKFSSCDMDDAIFSFLGGLLGMLCFVMFNLLFQKTTGKNFDGSEIERDYYGRKI